MAYLAFTTPDTGCCSSYYKAQARESTDSASIRIPPIGAKSQVLVPFGNIHLLKQD